MILEFPESLLTYRSINSMMILTVRFILWEGAMKNSDRTEKTVNRIIEAAMTEFGSKGYSGGTVNNITKAGINKGLIYHNFRGKDELYLICIKCSCKKLLEYIHEHDGASDMQQYMRIRMDFFNANPKEAHIFFDALLNPPSHLFNEIGELLKDFNLLNEQIYTTTLNKLVLREDVSREDALSYFHLMQTMLNGYFSSPVFQNVELSEKVKIHESVIPKLFDYMLHGIAKGAK